jgi:N-acetylglucosamine-6-sulfatase
MLAVDEMIGRLMETLKESGKLENTYIFFTSDNGYHIGQHRLTAGKWTAYDEDTRVPLIVRGPGVQKGRTLSHLVLNNDLAPTLAKLAEVSSPPFVDGRSLRPLLKEDPPPPGEWRSAFLVEAASELGEDSRLPLSGDARPGEDRRSVPGANWGRPGLEAVRTADHLYVEYETGERELYDLKEDPYQLRNWYDTADPNLVRRMEERLETLRGCAGATCEATEDGH